MEYRIEISATIHVRDYSCVIQKDLLESLAQYDNKCTDDVIPIIAIISNQLITLAYGSPVVKQ